MTQTVTSQSDSEMTHTAVYGITVRDTRGSDASDGGRDGGGDDLDAAAATDRWTELDYGSANRVDDIDETYADADRPLGPPEQGRTGWKDSDVPDSKQAYFQWLASLNEDWDSETRHYGDISRMVDVAVGQLDLSDVVREQAKWLLERLDIQDQLGRRTSVAGAVLAVISLLEDAQRSRYAPTSASAGIQSVRRDDGFRDLRHEFEVDRSEVTRLRTTVRDTDLWSQRHQ